MSLVQANIHIDIHKCHWSKLILTFNHIESLHVSAAVTPALLSRQRCSHASAALAPALLSGQRGYIILITLIKLNYIESDSRNLPTSIYMCV